MHLYGHVTGIYRSRERGGKKGEEREDQGLYMVATNGGGKGAGDFGRVLIEESGVSKSSRHGAKLWRRRRIHVFFFLVDGAQTSVD